MPQMPDVALPEGSKMNTPSKHKLWLGGTVSSLVVGLIVCAACSIHGSGAQLCTPPDVEVVQVEQKENRNCSLST